MKKRYSAWALSARHCLSSPLTDHQRLMAAVELGVGESVVIDKVVLKVEPCDWPEPHGTGWQFFGLNQFGAEIGAESVVLDHPGVGVNHLACVKAVEWAERQKLQPAYPC
jgi:hypothetical protein